MIPQAPIRRRVLAIVAVVLGLAATVAPGLAPAGAQQAGNGIEITGIDLTGFPEVNLRVAVSGEAAFGAAAEGLTITENDAPLPTDVEAIVGEVIGVVLAVDTSGSMEGDAIDQAKVAANQLLGQLPPDARVALVSFNDTAQLISGFTTERDTTRAAIDGLRADGGTALFDAVIVGAQQARASDADRTALVVLTDGRDADSTSDLEAAKDAVSGAVDDFYAVGLQTEDTDTASLNALAEAAGGRVVSADPDALAAAYVTLGQRIANQYQVSFTSVTPDQTGTFVVGVPGLDSVASVAIALPDRPAPGSGEPTPTTTPGSGQALPNVLVTRTEPSLLEKDFVLYAGAGLIGIAIALTAVLVAPSSDGRERRRSLGSDAETEDGPGGAAGAVAVFRGFATRAGARAVERADAANSIDVALDRAGIVMRAGEFVAAVAAVAIGAAVLGYLLLGVVGGAIGLLVPIFGANAFLKFRANRRNAKFANQLSDTLLVMSGALRSGFGVGQAIDTVAEELDPPMSSEFQRAILETRLGRDIEDALEAIAARVDNEDFEWVVDAMRINKQVGGDLAHILDQVSETIRQRNRLKRQVAALTAEGRISALVLGVLPVGIGLVLYSSNPDYMDPLFNRTAGRIMLGIGIGLLVTGALWLKKMIDIEY